MVSPSGPVKNMVLAVTPSISTKDKGHEGIPPASSTRFPAIF